MHPALQISKLQRCPTAMASESRDGYEPAICHYEGDERSKSISRTGRNNPRRVHDYVLYRTMLPQDWGSQWDTTLHSKIWKPLQGPNNNCNGKPRPETNANLCDSVTGTMPHYIWCSSESWISKAALRTITRTMLWQELEVLRRLETCTTQKSKVKNWYGNLIEL